MLGERDTSFCGVARDKVNTMSFGNFKNYVSDKLRLVEREIEKRNSLKNRDLTEKDQIKE